MAVIIFLIRHPGIGDFDKSPGRVGTSRWRDHFLVINWFHAKPCSFGFTKLTMLISCKVLSYSNVSQYRKNMSITWYNWLANMTKWQFWYIIKVLQARTGHDAPVIIFCLFHQKITVAYWILIQLYDLFKYSLSLLFGIYY